MKSLQINTFREYKAKYEQSVKDPEGFWAEVAEHFHWQKKWDKVLDCDFDKPEIVINDINFIIKIACNKTYLSLGINENDLIGPCYNPDQTRTS